ncbi:MAG: cytochrome b561 domain-containing protein [Pseudomonadota bacterium]
MFDWLLGVIDPTRAHEVGFAISWHGRLMVVAWGVFVPIGILVARYFKVWPGQNWPKTLDTQMWWNTHRIVQTLALIFSIAGIWLVFTNTVPAISLTETAWLHGYLGWSVFGLCLLQFASGLLRGTKGGPTDDRGQMRGDHYDMTPRRIAFEWTHKIAGYLALIVGALTILLGLWQANAPRWMWIGLIGWWAFLILVSIIFQKRRMDVDTYQALWGPDSIHPGNRIGTPRVPGLRRIVEPQK